MEKIEETQKQQPQKKSISDVVNEYNKQNIAQTTGIPTSDKNVSNEFKSIMNQETDPDLMTVYELVDLPSKGLFYDNKISQLEVEYMTSKDEDLITTPSLIESGKVLDILLKRKIKTKGVIPEMLLPGDRNAILLFLRTSSYGFEYNVTITDPRTGVPFKTVVNLNNLKYKEMKELPDAKGHFSIDIPMRKKKVIFRLLNSGEENEIYQKAEEIKEAYNLEFSEYNTMKLKASIISIDGKTDRSYIDRFVDAMPALDALTIRKKIIEVSPDIDMTYEFKAKDGFKFKGQLTVDVDFFFPVI